MSWRDSSEVDGGSTTSAPRALSSSIGATAATNFAFCMTDDHFDDGARNAGFAPTRRTEFAARSSGSSRFQRVDASGSFAGLGTRRATKPRPAPASSCTTNGGNPGDCAIGFKNNFQMSSSSLSGGSNTAVLLFAPNGPVAFKNNAQFNGAVYANNIQVKNNMNMAYDPRIDQIVGFGDVTLDINSWMECTPGSVTTSAC